MSVRTSRNAIPAPCNSRRQRGISGVTIAVVLAACAVVTLTIVQAATATSSTVAESGIPGLIG
jgi:hypothetical protein